MTATRHSDPEREPRGEMHIRTIAMPADANPNGDIFGGWVLSQMDVAGGLAAARRARGRVVTVGIEAMTFVRPVAVGDVLCCYGDVVRVGTSSIAVAIEAWKIRWFDRREERMLVTEGLFTYVAIDEQGSKRPVEA
ncbi:MAG TPA: hotdog domain-containing protein [Thalassobaculum sp.]